MYRSYWGLCSRPFENTLDPAFYYSSQSHQSTLLRLRYALEDRCSNAALIGLGGIGKTLMLHNLKNMESMRQTMGPFIHAVFPQLDPNEMLAFCCAGLCMEIETRIETRNKISICETIPQLNAAGSTNEYGNEQHERTANPIDWFGVNLSRLVRETERLLVENAKQGNRTLLVIDEADMIENPKVFRVFKSLLGIEHEGKPCLSFLFIGEGSLLTSLALVPALEQRIEVKCVLEPFREQETDLYINHRLRAAGCRREIFGWKATALIHELTHGIPRHINRLCDLALLVGFVEKANSIRMETVETLYDELLSI